MFKRYKRKRYNLYSAIYTQCNVSVCGKNTSLTCSKCCKIGSSKDKYWRKLSLFKLFFKDVNNKNSAAILREKKNFSTLMCRRKRVKNV